MGDIQYNPFAILCHGILEIILTQFRVLYNTLHYFKLKVTYCVGPYFNLKPLQFFDIIMIVF